MHVKKSIDEVCQTVSSGSDADIKSLIAASLTDAQLRSEWAKETQLWQIISTRLEATCASRSTNESSSIVIVLLRLANNIAATPVSGSVALSSKFPIILAQLSLTAGEETRLFWQVMANLSFGLTESHSKEVQNLVAQLPLQVIQTSDLPPTTSTALLLCLANLLKYTGATSIKFVLIDCKILNFIFNRAAKWFEGGSQYDALISATNSILFLAINAGLFSSIASIKWTLSDQVTLYKLIDAVVSSPKTKSTFLTVGYWETDAGNATAISVLSTAKQQIANLLPHITMGNRQEESALLTWNLVCTLLELLSTILPYFGEQTLKKFRENLLHELIALLKAAKDHLPARTKLNEVSANLEPDLTEFPLLITNVIPVISCLVRANEAAKDEMRESGGLKAILESCVIDVNNPFMKEKAILCIRLLLANNQANQEFVAKMEARQVADPGVLEEAGYESEFVNGQLKLKQRQKQH